MNVAIKVQISNPLFTVSGKDTADYHELEPSEARDGDTHKTVFEFDPVDLDDMERELLNRVLTKLNEEGNREVSPGKFAGARVLILPSDGRK